MTTCPSRQELGQFDLGKLPPERMRWIAAHLDSCLVCAELLGEFEAIDDELLEQLRQPIPREMIDEDDELHNLVERVLQKGGSANDTSGWSKDDTPSQHQGAWNIPYAPALIGPYQILGEIARGGMGVVYKAYQPSLHRTVAIKMLLTGRLADADQVRRFQAEAEAAAALDHPGIVPVYEIGEHEGRAYFSMGYVDGPSLAERLKQGPMEPLRAAALLHAVAEAVQYAHNHGVIHRDLKPSNILLSTRTRHSGSTPPLASSLKDGPGTARDSGVPSHISSDDQNANFSSSNDMIPRITDFGLAKRVEFADGLTVSGQVMGTPSYMPPEQAAGRQREIGPASDVYSLGAILYHALTGRPPFQADNIVETLRQVVHQQPVAPRELNPAVDRDLNVICLKCLKKDPAARYSTASALAEDLYRYEQRLPIHARKFGRVERFWRWTRRHPWQTGLVVVALVAASCLSAFAYFNKRLDDSNRQLAAALEGERQTRSEEASALEHTELALYAKQIANAYSSWRDNNLDLARNELANCREESRDWEWHYVASLCRRSVPKFAGHRGAVLAMDVSPDGSWIVSGSNDGTLRIWSLDGSGRTRTLSWSGRVLDVAISPDGKLVASAGDNNVKIWDAESKRLLRTLDGHKNKRVWTLDFSPDGKRLATGGEETVKIWNLEDDSIEHSLNDEFGQLDDVCFSPNGKYLAAASDSSTRLFEVATGEKVATLRVPRWSYNETCISFSNDSTLLATVALGGLLKVYDVESNQLKFFTKVESKHQPHSVTFLPNRHHLVTGNVDGSVSIWDLESEQEVKRAKGHTMQVESVVATPDGQYILTGSYDETVKMWSSGLEDGRQWRLLFGHRGTVSHLSTSSGDDEKIVSISPVDKTLKLWDERTGAELRTLDLPGEWRNAACSADGKFAAVVGADRTVKVWEIEHLQTSLSLSSWDYDLEAVAISSAASAIALGGSGRVAILDTDTAVTRLTINLGGRHVRLMHFNQNGDRLLVATESNVSLWDTATGDPVFESLSEFAVDACAFSQDGTRLAFSSNKLLQLHDTQTGKQLYRREAPGSIHAIAFSPNGRRIATCGERGLTSWDARFGLPLITFAGPDEDGFQCVAFTGDGNPLVTSTKSGTLCIWDARRTPSTN